MAGQEHRLVPIRPEVAERLREMEEQLRRESRVIYANTVGEIVREYDAEGKPEPEPEPGTFRERWGHSPTEIPTAEGVVSHDSGD